MKILYISPINTVGTLDLWKKFHKSKGHECEYITFFNSPLDVDNGICLNLPFIAKSKSSIALRKIYYQLIRGSQGEYEPKEGYPPTWESSNRIESLYFHLRDWIWSFKIEPMIKKHNLDSYDIYHFEWGLDFYRNSQFAKRLKNKKIICTYHGQDLRTRGVVPSLDKISDLNLTSELDLLSKHPNLNYLFLPIDISKYQPVTKTGETIKICHSPTNRYYKGSDDIIEACSKIAFENNHVEFILIENKTQNETIQIKSSCDILIDQIHNRGGWGYGMSSVEAMAMGLCCATELNSEYEEFIQNHPFVNVNKDTLYNQLSELVNDVMKLDKLKNKSVQWVSQHHDIQNVGKQLYQYYEQL